MANTVKYTGWGHDSLDHQKFVLTWYWNNKYTKEFLVTWTYVIRFGNGLKTTQTESSTVPYRKGVNTSVFTIPSNAYTLQASVKPVSKTYTKDKKQEPYFTAKGKSTPIYDISKEKPPKPNITPSIGTIRDNYGEYGTTKYTIIVPNIPEEIISGPNKAEAVDFYILAFDGSGKKTLLIMNDNKIVPSSNGYSARLDYEDGIGVILNFCYRYVDVQGDVGQWSDFTGGPNDDRYDGYLFTRPNDPKNVAIQVDSYDDVNNIADLLLTYDYPYYKDHVLRGYLPKKMEIEYVVEGDNWEYDKNLETLFKKYSAYVKKEETEEWKYDKDKKKLVYYISNIEIGTGKRIFVRVRNVETRGYQDGRSDNKSVSFWKYTQITVAGKVPEMPTIWSSKENLTINDSVDLFWIHNSESKEKQVEMKFTFNFVENDEIRTVSRFLRINNTESNNNFKMITFSALDLIKKRIPEGVDASWYGSSEELDDGLDYDIRWMARTKNEYSDYGPYSDYKRVKIYQQPVTSLSIIEQNWENVNKYPIDFNISYSSTTQNPLSHYFVIKAKSKYYYMGIDGIQRDINAGDVVFEKTFINPDIEHIVSLLPTDAYLQDGLGYEVSCTTSFDSGLEASDKKNMYLALGDEKFQVGASINYIKKDMTMRITPFIGMSLSSREEELTDELNQYDITDIENRERIEAELDKISESDGVAPMSDQSKYLLSVYRMNNDRTFTIIDDYYQAGLNAFSIDVHPNIGRVLYRVIGINKETGKMIYSDFEETVNEDSIIINWDEKIEPGPVISDENEMADSGYSTNVLKLLYDIEVSDNHSNDVSLVEYIGRKNPVSYYGTQKSHQSTWNTKIPKDDIDTLNIIRQLATYPGDCYIREPSGSGYWANVKISYSQKYDDLTIPISLSIVKVEGGK